MDENGRKFSRLVENAVEKGKIARNKQLLLFPQCLPKICTADTQKTGLAWETVECFCPVKSLGLMHEYNITFIKPQNVGLDQTDLALANE